MNGQKINDCVTNLNKLLKPDFNLTVGEKEQLFEFFKEEKIKSVTLYKPEIFVKAEVQVPIIKEKKETLMAEKRYDEMALIRDLEKRTNHLIQFAEALKRENIKATFAYREDGLSLYIVEGDYDHTIQGLRSLGLKA